MNGDIVDAVALLLEARAPCADPVALGVKRYDGHVGPGRALVESGTPRLRDLETPHQTMDPAKIVSAGFSAKRAAQGNHLANCIGTSLGEFTGVDTAQALADHTDLLIRGARDLIETFYDAVDHLGRETDVGAQAPRLHRVSQVTQESAYRKGRAVVGSEAGQHEDAMTIAAGV